jgi:hypothetical protein
MSRGYTCYSPWCLHGLAGQLYFTLLKYEAKVLTTRPRCSARFICSSSLKNNSSRFHRVQVFTWLSLQIIWLWPKLLTFEVWHLDSRAYIFFSSINWTHWWGGACYVMWLYNSVIFCQYVGEIYFILSVCWSNTSSCQTQDDKGSLLKTVSNNVERTLSFG